MKSPAQLAIEALDEVARAHELKWGVDRLPRLVAAFDPELAAKYWRQFELLEAAIDTGMLSEQETQANRMRAAWLRLDREAEAAGCEPLSPKWFEGRLEDGRLLIVTPDIATAHRMANDNREAVVWSMDEIARVLWRFEMVNDAKTVWPGAVVQQARVNPERVKPKVDWKKGDELPVDMLMGAG
jgi:hypothetical protein